MIPLFVTVALGKEDPFLGTIGIALILALVAIGVLLTVRVSIVWGSYQMLLEEGDYSRENKVDSKRYEFINGAYWCLITAGYLAWSFIENNWNRSWIIWPVAGVAYAAIYGIIKALRSKQ